MQKLSRSLLGMSALLLILLAGHAAASPYFAIGGDGNDCWDNALATGLVTPLDQNDWDEIELMWQTPEEGNSPPTSEFKPAELYVYSPLGNVSASPAMRLDTNNDGLISFPDLAQLALKWLEPVYDYSFLEGEGLVMAWGDDTQGPNEPWSSGWKFTYGEDPDLTNVTISCTITPPSGMTIVFFGMQDINGGSIAWLWSVGNGAGFLKPNIPTLITIDTSISGVGAATPTAPGYAKSVAPSPVFDITKVISIFASTTNGGSSGSVNVPPPYQTVIKPWNLWQNLTVVPNSTAIAKADYYKWQQPAQFVGSRGNIWGWDEMSIDPNVPLLADDWCCMDNRPVTGVQWWGSFPNRNPSQPGWTESSFPLSPIAPTGFHIGIWSDSPGDPNGQDLNIYSHPNDMIFDQYVYTYDVSFVGYDRDPRDPNYAIADSCFKFSVDLDPNFAQDPCTNSIYWLSIAAVYDPCMPDPNYVWGWKSRPHYFNDTAVRINGVTSGTFPITTGQRYSSGNPVEYPDYCGWDLAFELATDANDTNSCVCITK